MGPRRATRYEGGVHKNCGADAALQDEVKSLPEITSAVQELANVGQLDRDVRTALIDLLETRDARLRRATVDSLAKFDDAVSRKALARHYETSVIPREKRAIEATFGR